MRYRALGKTGLRVSEIGLGGEWLEKQPFEDVKAIIDRCDEQGINILDCWMSNPTIRENIGRAIAPRRGRWIVQGHLGSVWQDGQYVRTREMGAVKQNFTDLMRLMDTDYIDLGMMHFVDEEADLDRVLNGEFYAYARHLKEAGVIRYLGMSSHNPAVAQKAAELGAVDLLLFSLNPAFDLLPASEDINTLFDPASYTDLSLRGISPDRDLLYRTCESRGVGITVMKGLGSGRLLNAETSAFGVAMTPVQCLHYDLTRPAVASVLVGYDKPEQVDAACAYETATDEEKNYAAVLAAAPKHAFFGECTYCGHCAPCPSRIDVAMVNKLYDLAALRDEVPPTVRAHYQALSANAADCIGCGACEARCPFGVKVVERMEKTRKLFD